MHVLLIHQNFVLPGEAGGTRHYELGRHLAEAGDAFTAVAGEVNYQSGQRHSANGQFEENVGGVRVVRAYTYPALHRSFLWRVVSFASFMSASVAAALRVKDVDLVMGTSPPLFQAVSAWLVARLRKRPFLLEIRDLWPEFAIDMGVLTNPALIRLSRQLEAFLYRQADHLLVNSPAYRDYLNGKGVPAAKISFIPNGVDPEMFDPAATGERVRQQWGLEDRFVAIYAGALGMANNIDTVLQAAARLQDQPEIRFLLVGDGKERSHLEAQARQLGLKNVTFTGSRPKSEMVAFLAAADVCLATLKDIPMFRTTYPNKVFDYMAAGRPTVLAIDGVIRAVVEDAGGGLYVPPEDNAALAKAVLRLYQNRSETVAMGKAARAYVAAHFHRRRQAQEFAALVHRLVQSSPSYVS